MIEKVKTFWSDLKAKSKPVFEKLLTLSSYQKYFLRSLLFLAICAIMLTWFLEYRARINCAWCATNFMINSPRVFFYSALIMLLIVCFVWGFVRKPGTAVGVTWIGITILTYVHINKFNTRQTPLLPEDFELADQVASLTKFVDIAGIVRLILALAIIVILTVVFNKYVAKKLKLFYKNDAKAFAKRHLLLKRAVIICLSAALFMNATEFVRHHNGARYEDIPFLKSKLTAWSQPRNYDQNGFILGFLYNIQKLKIEAPSSYSEGAISEIKEQYEEIAKAENIGRKDPKDEDVSVVVILNETFYDASVKWNGKDFETYYPHSGGEIMPTIRRLAENYPSGYMYSLDYGGGTANIEFEVMTGLTNYWINAVPYTSLVPKAGKIPSIAQDMKKFGAESIAIHPYNGGMYKRDISLPNEGFDTFITQNEMKHQEHEGNSEYINDRSAYNEVLDVLKSTDQKQVIGLMTMQNHTPYKTDTYEELPFKLLQGEGEVGDWRHDEIEVFFQTIHKSDQYLGEFIDELDQMDKKVVVLFFGDHSAGIFDNTNNHEDKAVRDLSRLTPYFMYANYDDAFNDYSELPVTTPNCLTNTLYDRLNWQKDAQHYLVGEVCEAEPILTHTYVEGRNVEENPTLEKYKLVTYDILSGQKYWMK